jgi:ribosomal-protein-alanine N-acetyltransferase
MNVILESPRLLLRKFTIDDAALVLDLNIDPEVTRYTHDPVRDLEHAKQILLDSILPQYRLYNHGRWAVFLRDGLGFIGWCGLKYRMELDEVDLGYRFKKEFWGQGYATEAALACIQYGFEHLSLQRIVGRAVPTNKGSIKVLEKCGMKYIGTDLVDGHMAHTYDIFNPLIPH